MRVVAITGTGGPEVLELTEVPDPTPGPGEVLIDVAAAGLNRADLLQTQGMHPPPPGAPDWPGLEVSGTIVELGPGVGDWAVGDRVCALLDGGGYAERAIAPVEALLPVPDQVDLVEAAGLPESVCTVWSNLMGPGGMDPDHATGVPVLVHGGSGGVGSTAIQILNALGARVLTTAGGPERARRCADLGAEVAIDHRAEDFVARVHQATDGQGAKVILDVVGGAYLEQNLAALARHGHLVIIGLLKGRSAQIDLSKVMGNWHNIHGTLLRARPAHEKAGIVADVRKRAWPLVQQGRVRPVIHTCFGLDQAAAAQQQMADGEVFGKVLLVPSQT